MSTNDASNGREPVEHDGFEEELALFLSDDWHPASEADDDHGFDVSGFLEGLRNMEGVFILPAAVEVPLDAFVAAHRAEALHNLEVVVDNHGRTYLVGTVVSDGNQAYLVSVSIAADESLGGT